MSHNCIVVNLDRCTGCFGCVIACKMENNVAADVTGKVTEVKVEVGASVTAGQVVIVIEPGEA